jgi:hypothetical protein
MARGKRYKAASSAVDREKVYPLTEAVKLVKANAKAKFDETIEIAMNLGIDPRHADQAVRGMVELPSGTGKTVRVAVFARSEGGRGQGGRRRPDRRRRPRREDQRRRDEFRPLHRHARHDGRGRPPR